MEPKEFIEHCRHQLVQSYQNTLNGQVDEKQKYRTEGMFHAARLLGLMDVEQIQAMFEQEHLACFGESSAERQQRKKAMMALKAEDPEAYFAIPTIERQY